MRRATVLLLVFGLAACGAETGSNDEACREADTVAREVEEFAEPLSDEQANAARQWEFRLAEASVLATDHDLAVSIRDLADAAGNVAENLEDAGARDVFDRAYADVTAKCN